MESILDEVEPLFEKSERLCDICGGEPVKTSYYPTHLKTPKHQNNKARAEMLALLTREGPQGTNPPVPTAHNPPINLPIQDILFDQDEIVDIPSQIDQEPERDVLPQVGEDPPQVEEPMDIEPDAGQEPDLTQYNFDELWAQAFITPPNLPNIPAPEPERQRAPGGGRKPKTFNTTAARLLATFYQENKGRCLSSAMMQNILNLLRTAHITPDEVPPTVYYLEESGKLFLPKKEPTKINLTSGEVYYYPPEDIISEILRSQKDTLGWKYHYDSNDKLHPCSSLGWLEYENEFREKFTNNLLLLLVHLFADEYTKKKGSQLKTNAIVISVTNVSTENLYSRELKWLIADLPPGTDAQEFLNIAVIPFLQKLEKGQFSSFFYPQGRVVTFIGSCHAILGDYVGNGALAGIPSPLADKGGDRNLEMSKDDYYKEYSQLQVNEMKRKVPPSMFPSHRSVGYSNC